MINENDPRELGWILSNLDLAYVVEQMFNMSNEMVHNYWCYLGRIWDYDPHREEEVNYWPAHAYLNNGTVALLC